MLLVSTVVLTLVLIVGPGCCIDDISKQLAEVSERLRALESVVNTGVVKEEDWVLVFQINAGINISAYDTWMNTDDDDDGPADRLTMPCKCFSNNGITRCDRHYRSKLLNSWPSKVINQVRVSVYKDGLEKAFVTFNGDGTTRSSWFSKSQVVDSSWTDLKSTPTNFFSIEGFPITNRRFYISHVTPGNCLPEGWLLVQDGPNGCPWDKYPSYPVIMYSPNKGKVGFADPVLADTLKVWISLKKDVSLTQMCFV